MARLCTLGGTMSSTNLGTSSSGRVKQRMRTRQAILRAARELIDAGHTPTVTEAADAASVSRATAYRYYPSQESLLSECVLVPTFPRPEELFGRPDAPTEVEDRIVLVHDFLYDHIRSRETAFRNFLRGQLLLGMQDKQVDRTLRPAFRVDLIDAALEPITDELAPDQLDRLKNTLGVLIGTEALIASRDVLQLDDETARAHNAWACRVLVCAAREEAAQQRALPPSRRRTSAK